MQQISKYVKKNSLIIIKSTVPPKTTQEIYNRFFKEKSFIMFFT